MKHLTLHINDEIVVPISRFEERIENMNNKLFQALTIQVNVNDGENNSSDILISLSQICLDDSVSKIDIYDEDKKVFTTTAYTKADSLGTTLTQWPTGMGVDEQDPVMETLILFRKEL